MFESMAIWFLLMALVMMSLAVVYFSYWKGISYLFMAIAAFMLIIYVYRILFSPYSQQLFLENEEK